MDQPIQQAKASAIVIPVVALLIGGGIGYVVGAGMDDGAYERGYAQAQQDVRERIAEAPLSGIIAGQETLMVSGSITAINGDVVTISSSTRNPDPTSAPFPSTRRVRISSETSLTLSTEKAPEVFTAESNAFFAALQAAGGIGPDDEPMPLPTPPLPYTLTEITLADLVVGMTVSATAASDIARAESFDAISVTASLAPEPVVNDADMMDASQEELPGTEPAI